MDLSLRGSQINLATRYKPKAPAVKYPTLNQRPGSASIARRPRSSQFFRRPQSADEKLARSLDNCIRFSEGVLSGKLIRNKKYSSTSSSNLLKLLLEDPIKRPWLCRDSSDNQSETSQKNYNILQQKKQTSSIDASSMDEEYNYKKYSEDIESKPYSKSSFVSVPTIKLTSHSSSNSNNNNTQQQQQRISESKMSHKFTLNSMKSKPSTAPADFWHNTKPDLPGRVSFGKSEIYDMDLSDCENESTIANNLYLHDVKPSQTIISNNNKKSVHFGEVQSETFEYPKCPSDNCSCSTRSSVSATSGQGSQQQTGGNNMKCICDIACNSLNYSNLITKPDFATVKSTKVEHFQNVDDNSIITDYKNAIKNNPADSIQSDVFDVTDYKNKSLVQQKFDIKPNETSGDYFQNQYSNNFVNNFEYHHSNEFIKSDVLSSEDNSTNKYDPSLYQNNNYINQSGSSSSIEKNRTADFYIEAKRNSMHGSENQESSTIINNYLKVSSTPVQSKKTLNNSSVSTTGNISVGRTTTKSPKITKSPKTRRSKSASTNENVKSRSRPIMKKCGTYSSLRDDSVVDEFKLDKIDSWMSLNDRNYNDGNNKKRFQNFQRFSKSVGQKSRCNKNDTPETTETSENSKSDDNSKSEDDSTYDEIVSVIKEIEEEKKQDKLTSKKHKELDLKLQALLEADTPNTSSTGKETPDKLKDILNYLEDVEHSCDRTLMETRRSLPDTNRTEVDFAVEPDIAEDVPKLPDLLMLPNHQLARRIISLSLRANELANGIILSKQHVAQLRQEKQKAIRLEKQNSANRNRDQKKQFEKIVARHQGFIEQLLKDKGSLCEKVTALTRRLESQNQAWEHKLEAEISRIKETTLAGEKIRRERWVRENTKKIKELTVKGLEVEINKMTCEHQQEITNLKRSHQQELLDAVEETRLKYEQIENSIRESCAQDRESLVQKERVAIRDRFEKQLFEERHLFDETKMKLIEDFALERERLHAEIRKKDEEFLKKKQDLEKDKELAVEQVTSEFQKKLEQQEQKYLIRISGIEKQFESDFIIWKKEFESTCKIHEVENENTIRQNYRNERDRQIDAIVSRMDAESEQAHEEFELKINRLKEKHEKDIQEAEILEKSLREKFNDSRSRLAESEAKAQNHQSEIKQLKIELEHSKKMCHEFLDEKEKLKENAKNEVQSEIITLKTERDNEIQKIYKRVQLAIEKKDATIELLQKDNGSLRERCIKLEAVIRQQRKDYCVK